jgi:hypothetical protein
MMQSAMMQSVALGDTQCIEPSDDFVLVQHANQMSFDLKDDDDDSYDYCEDVYSLVSTEQTLSVCNEDIELPDLKEDMILTVPSMLLKELDEAHEAAKLAHLVDSEQRSVASTLSYAQSTDPGGESRDDFVSSTKDDVVTMSSRISNKKRRKKLKTMKKAAATASAAQALSERARAVAWAQHASAQKARQETKKPTGSRSSKKVANIAVVCAAENLSSYRQELMNAKHIKA